MPTDNKFFDESREQSVVKAEIVSKYFWAWANVILPTVTKNVNGRIAYIDLFAGPGRYKDETKSTPLLILERAIADPVISQRLVTIFNDVNKDNTESLDATISTLPGIEKLRYKPVVQNEEVGEHIVQMFEKMRLVPTLFFVDPWGYKGLSLRLINSVIKNWGCDCIFFFNYNRINMGITNPLVPDHMDALFGKTRADILRSRLEDMNPNEREVEIVEEIAQALKEMGGRFVLPFSFKNDSGRRTSHHLIFVSKHQKGYEIMKEIMANQSTTSDQGVPSFIYSQATKRQPLMFELTHPLDDLVNLLLKDFAGKTLTMRAVYELHNVGKPFIARNYKDALLTLERSGKITTSPPASKRKTGTFGDQVIVTFPLT